MIEQSTIVYNEIDFLIPSYRFNIRYSYVSKRGLSFIREYMLRIVHLSPMKASEISEYLGLSTREIKEAIRDLIERKELSYNKLGQVCLTTKSKAYFTHIGEPPQVSELVTTGTVLGFEVTGFNCISTQSRRLNDKWTCGLRVDVKSELVANRAKLAGRAFQRQFHDLIEKQYITNIRDSGEGKVNIYKIDSLKQIGTEPYRVKIPFSMDNQGQSIEVGEIDILDRDTLALDAILESLDSQKSPNNIDSVFSAIDLLEDNYTASVITELGLNIDKFNVIAQSQNAEKGHFIPFIGSLYSRENWGKFSVQLEKIKKNLIGQHQEGVKNLTWFAPSEGLWCRNNYLVSCLSSLIDGAKVKGKKQKTLYKPIVFVPIQDRRSSKRWKDDFEGFHNYVNGYKDEFCNGAVEVILLDHELVAVTYYVSLPNLYPTPVPIGFISTSKALVGNVGRVFNQFLTRQFDDVNSRDLGGIAKL